MNYGKNVVICPKCKFDNPQKLVIGDNVYIGPGAKLFGPIQIGDNTVIGANAVVNKSFKEGNCTIVGVPAEIISMNTSENLIL